jgi:tetratricopeptide (TPR) repeat protein
MYCINCGAQIDDNSEFCTGCGHPIQADEQDKPEEDVQYDKTKQSVPQNITPKREWTCKITGMCGSSMALLIIAVFVLQSGFIFKTLLLFAGQNAIAGIWTPVISIVTYLGFILALLLFIKDANKEKLSLKRYINTAISSLASVLILWGGFSAFGLVIGNLYGVVAKIGLDSKGQTLLLFAGYIILLLLLQLVLIAGAFLLYVCIRYQLSFMQTGKAFGKVLKWMFVHFPAMILLDVIFTVMMTGLFLIQQYVGGFISSLQPYAFAQVFVKYLISAILIAAVLSVIFSKASKMSDKLQDEFEGMVQTNIKGIPIIPIICAGFAVLALIIFPVQPKDGYSIIKSEIEAHLIRGDILRDTGYMTGAVKEYDSAMSKLLSTKSYLLSRKAILTENSSLDNDARGYMKTARELDPWNPYADFFEGSALLEGNNTGSAHNMFSKGSKNPVAVPEIFARLLRSSVEIKDNEQKKYAMDWLILNEMYEDRFSSLNSASLKKIEDWLEELDDIKIEAEPRLAYHFFEMTKYNDHQKAVQGIESLLETYPKNSELIYMLTRIYAEYRNEQNNYARLSSYLDDLSRYTDEAEGMDMEIEKQTYIASMRMTADDYKGAEKIIEKLYRNYADNQEITETYLYLLVKNSKFEEALNIAEALTGKRRTIKVIYQNALCLLNMGMHADSLAAIIEIEGFKDPYSEEYDRYLYAYSLAYANAAKTDENMALPETYLGQSIIYNYIMGMKGWRDKDSDTSNEYLTKVLDEDNRLGYAWYCRAINSYEQAVRSGSSEFGKAIEYYIKSISINPNHVETYFALAHCYKKADMKEEALRAFRKVVAMLPYQDHRVDPYGMTVHAQGEVNTLVSELEKEGN